MNNRITPVFLCQPQYSSFMQWQTLAMREHFRFELLEPSMPQYLDNEKWQTEAGQCYAASGYAFSLHGAFIDVNPASGDAQVRRVSRERIEQSCRFAAQYGMKHVVFHASAHPFLSGGYLDAWSDQCAAFFTEMADKYSVLLHIENSMDAYPDALEALAKRLGENGAVDLCLDLGHANYSAVSIKDWITRLGRYIGYLHLSDNMGQFDDHLPLGKGAIDWQETDSLWRNEMHADIITLEMNRFDDLQESVRFLRDRHYFGA